MKIAWLTPEIPYPPIGGRNGVFNRIKQLSKYNEIYLFSIAYSEEEKNLKSEMLKYCREVNYYNRNESKFKTILKSLFYPYSVGSRTITQLKRDIKELADRGKIDIIIVDFPNMATNVVDLMNENIYFTLNQHNTEFKRMRDMLKVNNIALYKKITYYLESFRLEAYEKSIYKKNMFKSITFFSEDDLCAFRNKWLDNTADLKLFPLGANDFNADLSISGKHNLLFIGRLDDIAITNVEAAEWFYEKVFGRILEKVPDAKLIIAGANPSKTIYDMTSKHVQIIPNYEELFEVYSKSDCVILPLLSGGGVKGKLLEAVALKKIIVTTSIGIEGTKFEDNKHVMLADNAEKFAEKCIEALLHSENHIQMVENAYSLFKEFYDWDAIGELYNAFLVQQVNLKGEKHDSKTK